MVFLFIDQTAEQIFTATLDLSEDCCIQKWYNKCPDDQKKSQVDRLDLRRLECDPVAVRTGPDQDNEP